MAVVVAIEIPPQNLITGLTLLHHELDWRPRLMVTRYSAFNFSFAAIAVWRARSLLRVLIPCLGWLDTAGR